jgi:hypothetical protein
MAGAALSFGGLKISDSPPDHSKGDELPAENVGAYLAHILSIQNAGPTGALQIYSLSAAVKFPEPNGNNMVVAVVWAATPGEAESRARAEALACGIEIRFFENGHTAVSVPTGAFAKEMKEAAGKVSRCVLAPFQGTPHRPFA